MLFEDGRLVAAAWYWSDETTLLVDPELDPAPLYADLLAWLRASGRWRSTRSGPDTALVDAVRAAGGRTSAPRSS